jgi:hypothetical protein
VDIITYLIVKKSLAIKRRIFYCGSCCAAGGAVKSLPSGMHNIPGIVYQSVYEKIIN